MYKARANPSTRVSDQTPRPHACRCAYAGRRGRVSSSLEFLLDAPICATESSVSTAKVVWMLYPASRAEHIRRCLVLARLDIEDAHQPVKPAAARQKDEALARIDQMAERRDFLESLTRWTMPNMAKPLRVSPPAPCLGEPREPREP